MVKGSELLDTPSSVTIEIDALPAEATRDAGTCAFSPPGSACPFHRTVDPVGMSVPVTPSVNPGDPAVTVEGVNNVIRGTGRTVSVCGPADAVPWTTRTASDPGSAMTLVGTLTVIWARLTEAVVNVAPPICTDASVANPVPVRVRVNAGPVAVRMSGLMPVKVSGSVTVRVRA